MTTETKTEPHWLAGLCDPGHRKDLVRRPYAVNWRGETWTVATDGRLLILLRGLHYDAPTPPEVEAKLLAVPEMAPPSRTPLDWPRFLSWVGPRPALVPCECCGGDGQCECSRCDHGHDCGACDGTGQAEPGACPAKFRGVLIDRHRLARHVGHLAAPTLVHADLPLLGSPSNGVCLVIDAPDWRLMLMALTSGEEEAPPFEESAP